MRNLLISMTLALIVQPILVFAEGKNKAAAKSGNHQNFVKIDIVNKKSVEINVSATEPSDVQGFWKNSNVNVAANSTGNLQSNEGTKLSKVINKSDLFSQVTVKWQGGRCVAIFKGCPGYMAPASRPFACGGLFWSSRRPEICTVEPTQTQNNFIITVLN